MGINPAEADRLELWQIASLMELPEGANGGEPDFVRLRVEAARRGEKIDSVEVTRAQSDAEIKSMLREAPPTPPSSR